MARGLGPRPAGTQTAVGTGGGFRHEALLYAGDSDFLRRTGAFLRDGMEAGEPAFVVVEALKVDLLRDELGPDADRVRFADMADVGRNPARIIPAWHDFVAEHAGTTPGIRGIGEPIWAGRPAVELVECQRHESLLNLAFADADDFWLLCPYDTDALDPDIVEHAKRTHPMVDEGKSHPSRWFEDPTVTFADPLPEPAVETDELSFDVTMLDVVRRFVERHAADAGWGEMRSQELTLAANELATNSVRYGGGGGSMRIWGTPDAMWCEVRDRGLIDQPLAGRERPRLGQIGGYGLWVVNQLCDLVQIRTFESGSVVRIRMMTR